jgi:hypothetical protein
MQQKQEPTAIIRVSGEDADKIIPVILEAIRIHNRARRRIRYPPIACDVTKEENAREEETT